MRKNKASKQAPAPVAPAPIVPTLPVAAPIAPRALTRDAATVHAMRANFETFSSRDDAYLAFFGSVMRRNAGKATLAQLHDAGTPNAGKPKLRSNPHYAGSAKATDAGAIIRLIKSGYFTADASGNTLTATKLASDNKAYNAIK